MTLVSGSVKILVMAEGAPVGTVTLKPGQGASVINASGRDTGFIKVQAADLGQVLAWQNGFFNFNNVRDLSLESLLRALKETGIHYRIADDRRLIILP